MHQNNAGEMKVSAVKRHNQMTHATDCINFSAVEQVSNVRKWHNNKVRLNMVTQWAVANHMLLCLHYIADAY